MGPTGATGPTGPSGDAGPTGPTGPAGTADGGLQASCLSPCHGFGGIVEQWKTSTHYATYIANLGGEEEATWTGPSTCGNCHALDGVEQRLAKNVTYAGNAGAPAPDKGQIGYIRSDTGAYAEVGYGGQATVAIVHCNTCHAAMQNDPHQTGAAYTPGSFPLRVPVGATDQVLIEKSAVVGTATGTAAGAYQIGNTCIWCHKSRKDPTNYIKATNVLSSIHWGPHLGPQADIYSGKGGYHFAGFSYKTAFHSALPEGCPTCHMPPVASNGDIGNHSFYAKLSVCTASCHAGVKNFDVNFTQTTVRGLLKELQAYMNTQGWLTRSETAPYQPLSAAELADGHYELDDPRPGSAADGGNASLTDDQAGALYNYMLVARGSGFGVHNGVYAKELLYDSYGILTGNPPASLPVRP